MKHLLYLPILFLSLAFSQETITFTNCGQEGRYGPSQEQCDTTYAGTSLDGNVNLNSGIQEWVVPHSGTYFIEVWGAAGGTQVWAASLGGQGARMQGEFNFEVGDIVQIIVGQKGENSIGNADNEAPGGGGQGGGGGEVVWNWLLRCVAF